MIERLITLWLGPLTLGMLGACAQQPLLPIVQADSPPATQPGEITPASRPDDEPTETVGRDVERVLDALEHSADDLRDFRARIRYDTWDAVLQRNEIRTGELLYQVDPADGSKRFAILFDTLITPPRREDRRAHFIFSGSWFVEIDHERRQFIKRQVVAPGEQFDPLKLGEGPFPLPIGQPKEEVLKRFVVKQLERPSDPFLAERLRGRAVDGLLLTPKPSTPEAEDVQRVELFYDRKTHLPLGVHVVEESGDRKTVLLRDLHRNEGIDEAKLSIETPDPKEGWHIDIRPWRPQ